MTMMKLNTKRRLYGITLDYPVGNLKTITLWGADMKQGLALCDLFRSWGKRVRFQSKVFPSYISTQW